jgi:pSer/pThr/pTyr-binding forkhead associated (FHA) protein
VWGESAVTDDAVRAQVAKLRRVLGDSGGDLVTMVRREGYRWDGDVQAEAADAPRPVRSVIPRDTARFRLVLEGREIQLLEGSNLIGRDAESALWIDHASVSRRHARVVVAGGRASLEDLQSKNGTFLRGRRISKPEPLSNGDEIRIGVVKIVFRTLSRLQTTQPAREP